MAARLQRLRREGPGEVFLFAGPAFRRAAPWLFAAILLAGLITRLHPAVRYGVWGSDSGEYLFLTKQLAETGRVSFPYDGWGLAYPYFPGMFVLSGAVHAITGVDVFYATQWTTPIVASLTGVLVGLIAYRVTSDPRAGVLSGAFVAVCGGIVITTSHPMPGALGQVFVLGLLALVPDMYRDRWNVVLLAVLGVALVLTHHLSTYFAIGALAFIPFYREMTQRHSDAHRLRVEIPVVGAFLALALVWWLAVAKPFRDEIVGDALPFNPWITAFLFLAALASLPALVMLRRARSPWHLNPRYPNFRRQRAYILGGFFGFLGVLLILVFVRLPGTNIELGWPTIVYAIPLVAWLSFLPLGLASVRFHRHGSMLVAWLYAILGSLAFAIATNSHVLFPFRHVDYMLEAMAPLLAVGMLMWYDQALSERLPSDRPRVRANFMVGIAALLLVSSVLSLPPRETLGGFEEGMTRAELEGVRWAGDHLPRDSTIAADHRLSSLLFGLAHLAPTWDYAPDTYHSDDPIVALRELSSAHVPSKGEHVRVDHVMVTPGIEEGVTLLQWENSAPMTEAAIVKFEDARYFETLYDENDVRIYRVKWESVGTLV
ncbi:MAG TPA: hypothetical protein VM370_12440 [Candidatus Thermoplasmatota archaeon]|nr:hypothetical protein [Candidatus Thermoplasmatota archaeon]